MDIKKRILIFCLIASVAASLNVGMVSPCFNSHNTNPNQAIGEWQTSNGQPYYYAQAPDRYALGYLEGSGLAIQIYTLKAILIQVAPVYGLTYETFRQLALGYLPYIPQAYIEEFTGMVDGVTNLLGSGVITFDDVLIQNTFLDVFYGIIIPKIALLGCTSFGAINIACHQQSTIIGQNFDFSYPFNLVLAWVHSNINGKECFTLRLGGGLGLPCGKSNTVSACVNVVQSNSLSGFEMPVNIKTRMAFDSAKNAAQFARIFLGSNTVSINLLIADRHNIFDMEIVPNQVICHKINGWAPEVNTNTYTTDTMQQYLINDYSKDRQEYAETLLCENYSDRMLSESELLTMLQDAPMICRPLTATEAGTMAFFTPQSFGLGNPANNPIGFCPL